MPDDLFDDFINEMASGGGKRSNPITIHKGTDLQIASHVPYGIPTRIPQLDLAIGKPGYPVGRILVAYGKPKSGKTTAALHAIASVQKAGGYCMFIDTETHFDPLWAAACGCDPERIMLVDALTIEDVFRAHEKALDSMQKVGMDRPMAIVTDSITGVPSQLAMEKDWGEEARVGQDARVLRQGFRKLNHRFSDQKPLIILINHAISNINAMAFAKQTSAAGGYAMQFYASVIIEFSRTGNVTSGEGADRQMDGMKVKIALEKNKVAHQGRVAVNVQLLDHGFDIYDNLFLALQDIGELTKLNAQRYVFEPTQTQLAKKEWRTLVDDPKYGGGIDRMYKWFLNRSLEKGFLKPYGV